MAPPSFDVALESLLAEWEPRIGRPTCGPGCSRCCERMTVIISSAEALRLLDHVGDNADLRNKWQQRAAKLRSTPHSDPVEAQNVLIDLGPCTFLNDEGSCGIYEARPDACRACNVWHTADHCGREDYDMCTPAELNALRVDRIHALMLQELDLGRRPFWGQLLPMVVSLDEHRDHYRAGDDLASSVDQSWLQSELIEFSARQGTPAEIRMFLETEQERLKLLFSAEENPMGYPRGTDAPDREFLAAFPLD